MDPKGGGDSDGHRMEGSGNKMKETDGIEWKEGGRCMGVGKKGAAAAIKEEKTGVGGM